MTSTDAYTDWDAAYVLGALSAAERVEFEQHLAQCPRCQAAVAELAGVPGLLGQLPPGEALALDEEDRSQPEPPGSLMPVLPVVARPAARRPRALVLALAAAVVVGALGGYAVSAVAGDRAPGPVATATSPGGTRAGGPRAERLAFSPVEPSLMTAVVDVVPVAAGTELRVECQYARGTAGAGSGTGPGIGIGTDTGTGTGAGSGTGTGTGSGAGTGSGTGAYDGGGDGVAYAIWVVDRSGDSTELHSWTARPDVVMHPVGRSELSTGQIRAVEIRRVADGRTVMRARLS